MPIWPREKDDYIPLTEGEKERKRGENETERRRESVRVGEDRQYCI